MITTKFAYCMMYNLLRGVQMTIYIDVLLAVNLYINYFLIRGTSTVLHRDIRVCRCIAAAAIGALFSLVVLFPELHFFVSAFIKLVSGCIVVIAAFGFVNISDYLFVLLFFLVVSYVYAGMMLALWIFAAPFGMFYRNGIAYFDVPIIGVALFTIAGYAVVTLVRRVADKKNISAIHSIIKIISNDILLELDGIADTGNSLTDPFNGTPVVICEREKIVSILPDNIVNYLNGKTDDIDGIRLAPCNTISGHTLVPVFSAEVIINGKRKQVAIGVVTSRLGADCIFNPRLLQ